MTELKTGLHENEELILAYLYNRGEYKSRHEIATDTRLNRNQVDYATDKLASKELVDVQESETRGAIHDAYVYRLNRKARKLVREHNLKQTQRSENSERIDDLEDQVMRLRSRVGALEQENEKLQSDLNETRESLTKLYESVYDTLEEWQRELF